MNNPRIDKLKLFADLGYEPHPGQLDIHLADVARRVVACGVRWGKTKCAAMEGLAAALQPAEHSVGWIAAPTYDLAERVFREILMTVRKHLSHHIRGLRESDGYLRLLNMAGGLSEIRTKSADSQHSLLGEGLDWVIIDEASRIKRAIWQEYLSQRLIDKDGWALMISTPKGKGLFYDMFRRGQDGDPRWRSWNSPSWTNPRLKRYLIEKEREEQPEKAFRQEYGAEFLEGEGSVFRYVRDCATGTWQEPGDGTQYYAGLDLARIVDFTVLAIMDRDRRLVFVDRFRKQDWSIQLQRIKTGLEKYGNPDVYVDATGAGQPVYELLRSANVNAHGYTFTMQSKDALISNLGLLFEQKRIEIPKPELWPEGIDELEEFEYSVTEAGNVRTGAAGSGHDDIVIALALAAWWHRPTPPCEISLCAPMVFYPED
jgi:hypothetical protein